MSCNASVERQILILCTILSVKGTPGRRVCPCEHPLLLIPVSQTRSRWIVDRHQGHLILSSALGVITAVCWASHGLLKWLLLYILHKKCLIILPFQEEKLLFMFPTRMYQVATTGQTLCSALGIQEWTKPIKRFAFWDWYYNGGRWTVKNQL